jgi:hypothetical protein
MTAQGERASAYRQTFRDFPGLPDPLCAEIRPLDEIGIRLHYSTLADVVKVAERFDSNIEFLERTAFVRVSTVYIACGEPMMAWTQLHAVEAFRLLRDWNIPVEFDPMKNLCPDVIKVPAAHAASMMKVA